MADDTISTGEKPRPAHLFGPGNNANPSGRPKGSRNKLGDDFLKALQADFEEHGADAIAKTRISKPEVYVKVVAGLLPKEITVNNGAFDGLEDDELLAIVLAAREAVGGARRRREGTADPQQPEPAGLVPPLH